MKPTFTRFLKLSLVQLFVLGLCLGVVELVCYGVRAVRFSPSPKTVVHKDNLYNRETDSNLGYVLRSKHVHRGEKWVENGLERRRIYQVEYKTDEHRRRIVRNYEASRGRQILLFGCSFAFGEGLNDRDTLQFQLSEAMLDSNVYNYAVHGWGTANTVAILQTRNLRNEVPLPTADAFYWFIPAHFYRNVGSTAEIQSFAFPKYELNSRGDLVRVGNFLNDKWEMNLKRVFLGYSKVSNLLSLLKVGIPPWITENNIQLTAKMIEVAKQRFERQFNGNFYVLVAEDLQPEVLRLRALLNKAGIQVVTYPQEFKSSIDQEYDGHPNATMTRKLAQFLTEFLRTKRDPVSYSRIYPVGRNRRHSVFPFSRSGPH